MIKDQPNKMARSLFNPYLARLLKKNFNDFILIDDFPVLDPGRSYLITPNHFCWWDGFFVDFVLRKVSGHQIKIMMLEEQLKKYWFFRFLGAFSIDQNRITEISSSINYSRKLLQKKNNAVVVYPQAKLQKLIPENLELKKGILNIVKNLDTAVIPLSFKIEYDEMPKPAVYCKAGKILESKIIETDFNHFENAFMDNLDLLLSFDHRTDQNARKKSLFND